MAHVRIRTWTYIVRLMWKRNSRPTRFLTNRIAPDIQTRNVCVSALSELAGSFNRGKLRFSTRVNLGANRITQQFTMLLYCSSANFYNRLWMNDVAAADAGSVKSFLLVEDITQMDP